MAVVGGDIKEITWNYPASSGTIFPKSNEDSTIDYGGYRGNDDANGVDGGGRMIVQLNANRWSVESTISWDMNINLDMKKISELAGLPVDGDWTFTHVNGKIFRGTGRPVGDVQGNSNAPTFTLKVAGGGILQEL